MNKGKPEASELGSKSLSFQCTDAIEISLNIEKQGLLFYESVAKKIQNPKVKKVFTRLAGEEREHIQSLQEKVQFLQPTISNRNKPKKNLDHIIGEGRIFPALNDPAMENIQSEKEALDIGIESERKSIEVLQDLLEKEKKLDVKTIFSHLLVEEKKHYLLLQELKKQL
jgi:rubrerythrin